MQTDKRKFNCEITLNYIIKKKPVVSATDHTARSCWSDINWFIDLGDSFFFSLKVTRGHGVEVLHLVGYFDVALKLKEHCPDN